MRTRALAKTLALGTLRALLPFQDRGVRVLMYHAVEQSGLKYSVAPALFEKQLSYVAKHCTLVPLSSVVAHARGERFLASGSVALTFDDGYLDTYDTVFPLLKQYRIPATVFLTTDLRQMRPLGMLPRLTESQIREMQTSGLVSFEAHGRTHRNLKDLADDPVAFAAETSGCADDIERLTSERPRFYAYAAGHRNAEIARRLAEHGFEAAFAITEGTVRPGDDPFSIRRVQIDGTMPLALARLRMTGPIDAYRRMVESLRRYRP